MSALNQVLKSAIYAPSEGLFAGCRLRAHGSLIAIFLLVQTRNDWSNWRKHNSGTRTVLRTLI